MEVFDYFQIFVGPLPGVEVGKIILILQLSSARTLVSAKEDRGLRFPPVSSSLDLPPALKLSSLLCPLLRIKTFRFR